MKKLSKKWTTLLIIIALILCFIIGFITYVNVSYDHVHSDIRLYGFIIDKILNLDGENALVKSYQQSVDSKKKIRVDDDIIVEEQWIQGRHGNDIRLLIFKAKDAPSTKATGLLWIHGGGYAIGSPESETYIASEFIRTAHSVVVSPDYTLSVEAPYPAALNDCYDTLLWMKENADVLGIDANQLFIGGGSAGGGLTAATTLYARDLEEVNIAFQMPLYPMINSRMDMPSAINNEEFIWNSKSNEAGWKLYLGQLYDDPNLPIYASPSEADNYENLPPTYTFVGTLDPFLDETRKYVDDLKSGGVEVTYHEYEKAYHGFDILGAALKADLSEQAISELLKAYEYATETYYAPQE